MQPADQERIMRVNATLNSYGEISGIYPDTKTQITELLADLHHLCDIPKGRGYCSSYLHVGQHGTAHFGYCIGASTKATETEYAPLKTELEDMGYNLEVI